MLAFLRMKQTGKYVDNSYKFLTSLSELRQFKGYFAREESVQRGQHRPFFNNSEPTRDKQMLPVTNSEGFSSNCALDRRYKAEDKF